MTHVAVTELVVLTVGALLYIALGAWVLTLTPRRRQTILLGAFAVVFGLEHVTANLLLIFDLVELWSLAHGVVELSFAVPSFSLALALAWSVPEPLEDRRPLGIALAVGLGLGILSGAGLFGTGRVGGVAVSGATLWVWAGFFVSVRILGAAVVLLALRARPSRAPDRSTVTQFALLAVALAMLDAFTAGWGIPGSAGALAAGDPILVLQHAPGVVLWLVAAGVWGWNMLQAGEETVRTHRAAMLGLLGLLAGGAVYFAALPRARAGLSLMRGVARTLGVGLLAYGILRHDLAGLDAKVEWTVSKTTVAGVFVAVFFIVSEGAQVLFAGFANSEMLGVIAAGALLFALSPIQKAADRIAEKAVPGGGAAGSGAEARYRTAVEVALVDGEITRDEEHRLAELADELELDATRALEVREDVEDDLRGEDAGGAGL